MLVPVLSLAALTGCKASCEKLCDDARDEGCDTTSTTTIDGVPAPKNTFDHVGCYDQCQLQSDMEDDGVKDCSDEFSALTDCVNEQSDICKVWDVDGFTDTTDEADHPRLGPYKYKKCESEREDYAICLDDFCADHTKRDYCN